MFGRKNNYLTIKNSIIILIGIQQAIKNDPKAMARVMRSYEMMLDFYGMKLKDPETGVLERSDNWEKCFHNLSWCVH